MFNWKLAGEVYGVFSKICFMIDSGRYEVTDEVVDAYEVASRDFENGEVNEEMLQVLLDFITDNTNSNYWIDFDEPLFNEDDEDIEILDDDCSCSCGCNEEPEIDLNEVKHWAKMIGEALDEAAKENGKPVKIKITLSEEE